MSTCQRYELRVHGCAGTPPETVLGVPAIKQVAGDAHAGFYRQRRSDGGAATVTGGRLVEAYRWSGLTSGGRMRALWLLLTPFMLVNVAAFTSALPLGAPRGERGEGWRARVVLERALRLLALTLTVLTVLSAVLVSMDLVGWQEAQRTTGHPAWLSFLDGLTPPAYFLVAAAVPAVLLVVLWALARQTWARLESTEVAEAPPGSPAPAGEPDVVTPLEDRRLWNGREPVRRLRAVHMAAGFGTLAAAMLLPLWFTSAGPVDASAVGVLLWVATVAAGALLVFAPAETMFRSFGRERPGPPADKGRRRYTALPWLGLAVVGAAAVAIVDRTGGLHAWPATLPGPATPLPGLAPAITGVLCAQVLLLLVAAVAAGYLRWGTHRDYTPPAAIDVRGSRVPSRPVLAGLLPAVLSLLACLLMLGWATGLALVVAATLGTPTFGGPAGDDLILPEAYGWATIGVVVAAGVLVLVLLGVILIKIVPATVSWACRGQARKRRNEVKEYYLGAGKEPAAAAERIRQIARMWMLGDMDRTLSGALTAWLILLVAAFPVVRWTAGTWSVPEEFWVTVAGVAVLAALAAALIRVGVKAFRDEELRRKIGILYDIATFWPREVHPLAPPCYMERTLPDMLRRLYESPPDAGSPGQILLSGHSQGSVFAPRP